MRLSFYRIKIFSLMRSHQISQILLFRIKYVFGISFKREFLSMRFFLIVFFVPVVCLCHKERGISKKNRPEKFLFHRNKELNCISCSVVCKITFRSEFPGIPDKPDRVTRRRTQAIAKCLVFHANAKRDFGTFIFL